MPKFPVDFSHVATLIRF